jgi:hypothetical protein
MHDIAMPVPPSADPSNPLRGAGLDVARALALGLPMYGAIGDLPPRTDISGTNP